MSSIPRFAILLSGADYAASQVTFASLCNQIYDNWRVVVTCKDAIKTNAAALLYALDFQDRIDILPDGEGYTNISADFIMPLMSGDELTPDCLAHLAHAAIANPSATLLYGDHAELTRSATGLEPFFKPDWSPEFLIATNYIGRAAVAAAAFQSLTLPVGYDAQDVWAQFLSFARQDNVAAVHVERLLLKIAPLSETNFETEVVKARTIVEQHLKHIGVSGRPELAGWACNARIISFDVRFDDHGPRVALIIPTRNNWRVLKRCLESLALTTYQNLEVVVVDNASSDKYTLSYLASISARILRIESPAAGFSYSYVNNEAVKLIDSDLILFLNDDTEVIAPTWLSQMVGWMQIKAVASVGARLLFPDDTLQHVGIVHRLNEITDLLPGLAYRCRPDALIAPRGQDRTVRNYAGLTAACLLVRRSEFLSSGSFDDVDFSVAYNDCDFGFRLTQAGRRHVFEPNAILYHHEGVSRGKGGGNDKVSEEIAFIEKYRGWRDPFFNANLSLETYGMTARAAAVLPKWLGEEKERISVGLVSHNLNYEGAPLVLLDIARGLVSRCGAAVTIFSPAEGPLRVEYEKIGCTIELVPTGEIYMSKTEEEFYRHLDPVAHRFLMSGVDIIVANTVLLHWGILAARQIEVPAVWLIHESEPPFAHLAPHGAHHVDLGARAMAEAALNVFVSRRTRDLYSGYRQHRPAEVIYNGFDTTRVDQARALYDRDAERARLGASKHHIVAILPGTVCDRKAQIDLIRAIDHIDAAVRNKMVFVIVGARQNRYTEELRSAVAAMSPKRRANVQVIDETNEIFRYFAAADIMTFTSHLESFPRVIQEAMFFGLAIVTTPVFGISEQLVDGKTGLFFTPGDVVGMARQIERVVRDETLRERLGRDAKLSLRRFPRMEEMQDAYWDLVRRVFWASDTNNVALSSVSVRDLGETSSEWWDEFIRF